MLTQAQLGLGADLERKFISMLERGERQPSMASLIKLARSLGVSAPDLVARVELVGLSPDVDPGNR
ncbi:MAG: helix-turn-helix transcriptional regulator [Paucibacter sp.]|nr:helix-turn-helix transcriptional regulator [Roseateles sp.]